MADGLKPCPFCGGEAELIVRDFTDDEADFGSAYAFCKTCNVESPYHLTEAAAIAAWNTRKEVR